MKFLAYFNKIFVFAGIFSFIFCAEILAAIPSYDELLKAPNGLARDYYIYRYASEKKPNKAKLRVLREKIYRYTGKIKTKFDEILGEYNVHTRCQGELITLSKQCQRDVITKKYLSDLSPEQRNELAKHYKQHDHGLYVFIKSYDLGLDFLFSQNSDFALMKFYKSAENKKEILDLSKFSPGLWVNLSSNWAFLSLVNEAVILDKNDDLKEKLLALNPSKPRADVAFLAGVNAIIHNDDKKALNFFNQAAKTAKNAIYRDNALFWVYLISKNKAVLQNLAKSNSINIYSLYAYEKLGTKPFDVIVPKPTRKKAKNYDITNPFSWDIARAKASKLKGSELMKFAGKFYTKETLGEYTYLMERAHNYKKHYYPLPFMDKIGTNDIKRQALILALARQESRFITGSVSISYALGMMQFMPFLARDIGKKELEIPDFDESDMFKPDIAYRFANHHLDYLQTYLKNPVFVAYAYNGGIGFVKKMLLGGKIFNPNNAKNKYEPFLSMELVPLSESRDYGKKVLANYIIYRAILGSSTKISQFFESLMIPADSDTFRQKQP